LSWERPNKHGSRENPKKEIEMVLIGTVTGGLFPFEEAVDRIKEELRTFPSPMSVPHLHERTGFDGDGILAILCYLERRDEVKSYVTNQVVKWTYKR